MDNKKILSISLGLLACSYFYGENNPNVICILADDIGYQDFGCYGAKKIKTPNIDKLASHGVMFANAYAPASVSSPSRYSLLTGEYAWRRGVRILPGDAQLCIPQEIMTFPKIMKQYGYHTAMVGKWHLGLGSGSKVDYNKKIKLGPLSVGFDYCYYYPATNDRVPCVYIEQDKVVNLDPNDPIEISYEKKVGDFPTGKEHPELLVLPYHKGHDNTIINGISRIGWMSGGKSALWNDEAMAENMCNKAIEYIKENKKHPFFLYYAPHNAHEPRVPSKQFKGVSEAGIYGDVIEEFDYCVGRIIETLKKEGIYDNTIIIITSDNGPKIKEGYIDGALENINGHNPYANLRGHKNTLYEGGCKVPFIVSWPSKLKKSFIQKQPFTFLDLKATIPSLLGYELSDSYSYDGADASLLFKASDAATYRKYIIVQDDAGNLAIRMGKWKLICRRGNDELYDLESDPSELRNMCLDYPDIYKKMRTIINECKK